MVQSGLRSFHRGAMAACGTALAGACFRKTRERGGRGGEGTFATERAERGIGAFAGRFARGLSFRRARRGCFLAGTRGEIDTGAASLGETDGDGLLCGPDAMNPLANVVHFFTNKFTGLRGGGFAFLFIALGASNGFLFGHENLL